MPILITDPRYVLLPNQTDRETAFNEWCRDTARKSRASKTVDATTVSASTVDPAADDTADADPALAKQHAQVAYGELLSTEVTSTRTTWDDFRRKWKKDRRFFAFGRDDREREKAFRVHLKDLGERTSSFSLLVYFKLTSSLQAKGHKRKKPSSSSWNC